jgi:hypothetical protein
LVAATKFNLQIQPAIQIAPTSGSYCLRVLKLVAATKFNLMLKIGT